MVGSGELPLCVCVGGGGGGAVGAKVLGKGLVPWRPTSLDNSRAIAYCTCSRCERSFFFFFFDIFSLVFFLVFLPPWETARYRLP